MITIRDAQQSDMSLIDELAYNEGMDQIPGINGIRVAVNDLGEVVAFCRLNYDTNDIAYVNPIITHPLWRGQGIGRLLIEDAHNRAGELRLISRGSSVPFYRKLGFAQMPWFEVDLKAASEDCDNCPWRETCAPIPMKRP